jgi:hypothetical protein
MLRLAREMDPAAAGLDEALAAAILGRSEAGEPVPAAELVEAAEMWAAIGEKPERADAYRQAAQAFAAASRWEDASWAAERGQHFPLALELVAKMPKERPEDRVRAILREARLIAAGFGEGERVAARWKALLVHLGPDFDVYALERAIRADRGGLPPAEVASKLEVAALAAHDIRALKVAFELAARSLSGLGRATELVRQAEVLIGLGAERELALRHGEGGLDGVPTRESAPLLERLAALAAPDEAVDLYERQISRARSDEERLEAIETAAQIAQKRASIERLQRFFDSVLTDVV